MNFRNFQVTIVGLGLIVFGTFSNSNAAQYDHEVQDKKISFAWKVEGDTMAVKMAAETDGWVGIGFNPSEKMKDAGFVLGYVKKGKAKIIDEFGDSDNSHKSDKKLGGTTDVTLISGTEEGGLTTIEFTMPLNSGDKNDTAIDVGGDTVVLLAYGAGRDSFKAKHKYRTALKVNLSTGVSQKLK